MYQRKYHSAFKDIYQRLYYVYIYIDSENIIEDEEIKLAGTPLTIEASEKQKYEPLRGSRATINLWSDSDRRFLDLYSIEPGKVMLKVYVKDSATTAKLMWKGFADTETYSELFSREKNYPVSFSFTDLGVLQRKTLKEHGIIKISELLDKILNVFDTGEKYQIIDNTSFVTVEGKYTDLFVNQDNFYNSDFEGMNYYEILDELIPQSCFLKQVDGKFIITDLDALYQASAVPALLKDAGSTLSVDRVYNNININYSSNSDREIITLLTEDEIKEKESIKYEIKGDPNEHLVYEKFDMNLSTSFKFNKMEILDPEKANFFYDENHDVGIVEKLSTYTNNERTPIFGGIRDAGELPLYHLSNIQPLFKITSNSMLSPGGGKFLLLDIDAAFSKEILPKDAESTEDYVELYIPAKINLLNKEGNVIYHYGRYREWRVGEGAANYSDDFRIQINIKSAGWNSSTSIKGLKLNNVVSELPAAGYIQIILGDSISVYKVSTGIPSHISDLSDYSQFWLKGFNMIMYDDAAAEESTEFEDAEIIATANELAKDPLDLKRTLGSYSLTESTAIGLYFDSSNNPIEKMTRNLVTDNIEYLLINSLFSNFNERCFAIEARFKNTELENFVFTVKNIEGKFIALSEMHDYAAGRVNMKLVQIRLSEYKKHED